MLCYGYATHCDSLLFTSVLISQTLNNSVSGSQVHKSFLYSGHDSVSE